jgi:hypothetical protein
MKSEFPDRVAAIVDLMSHLFMLAVMLFVLAIPFLPANSSSDARALSLKFTFYSKNKTLSGGMAVIGDEKSDVQIDVLLDDGSKTQSLEEGLRFLRRRTVDGSVEIDGYLRGHLSVKNAVVLFTSVRDELILSPLDVEIVSRSSEGLCHDTTKDGPVIGRQPFVIFNIATCSTS